MNFTPDLPFLGAATPHPFFSGYSVSSGGLSLTSLTQEKLGRKKGWDLLLSLKLSCGPSSNPLPLYLLPESLSQIGRRCPHLWRKLMIRQTK